MHKKEIHLLWMKNFFWGKKVGKKTKLRWNKWKPNEIFRTLIIFLSSYCYTTPYHQQCIEYYENFYGIKRSHSGQKCDTNPEENQSFSSQPEIFRTKVLLGFGWPILNFFWICQTMNWFLLWKKFESEILFVCYAAMFRRP